MVSLRFEDLKLGFKKVWKPGLPLALHSGRACLHYLYNYILYYIYRHAHVRETRETLINISGVFSKLYAGKKAESEIIFPLHPSIHKLKH